MSRDRQVKPRNRVVGVSGKSHKMQRRRDDRLRAEGESIIDPWDSVANLPSIEWWCWDSADSLMRGNGTI